jgi:hypothetical protein
MTDDRTTSAEHDQPRVQIRVYDATDTMRLVDAATRALSQRPTDPNDPIDRSRVGSTAPVLASAARSVGAAANDAVTTASTAAAAALARGVAAVLPVSKPQAKLLRKIQGATPAREAAASQPAHRRAPPSTEERQEILSRFGVNPATLPTYRVVAYDDGSRTALFAAEMDERTGNLTLRASMLPDQSEFKPLPEPIVIPAAALERSHRDPGATVIELSEEAQQELRTKVSLLSLAHDALHAPVPTAGGSAAGLPRRPARSDGRTV